MYYRSFLFTARMQNHRGRDYVNQKSSGEQKVRETAGSATGFGLYL